MAGKATGACAWFYFRRQKLHRKNLLYFSFARAWLIINNVIVIINIIVIVIINNAFIISTSINFATKYIGNTVPN